MSRTRMSCVRCGPLGGWVGVAFSMRLNGGWSPIVFHNSRLCSRRISNQCLLRARAMSKLLGNAIGRNTIACRAVSFFVGSARYLLGHCTILPYTNCNESYKTIILLRWPFPFFPSKPGHSPEQMGHGRQALTGLRCCAFSPFLFWLDLWSKCTLPFCSRTKIRQWYPPPLKYNRRPEMIGYAARMTRTISVSMTFTSLL